MLYCFEQHSTNATISEGCTDEELMMRLQQSDEAALVEIYRRHRALLCTIINRVVNNDTDTDDVFQEVMSEVWRMAHTYSAEKGKALGWIVTLARRRAIDRLRRKSSLQRAEDALQENAKDFDAAGHGADEDVAASDHAELLQRAMATLPEAQREALQLAFYRGMSQREIAAKTGIPLGTIKTRLELGVRKLRDKVLAMGDAKEWLQN